MTIVDLTDQNYNDFIDTTEKIIFIDFFSEHCAPCQALLSLLPLLAQKYENKDVIIAKVDVGKNPKLAQKYMVKSVPLTVVIGKDKMVKKAKIGLEDIESYCKMIDLALGEKKGFFKKLFGA